MTQNSKHNLFRNEGEETQIKNDKALMRIEQILGLVMEKLTDFELKLNYALLRRTKLMKKSYGKTPQNIQQDCSKDIMNVGTRIPSNIIYLSLTLTFVCLILFTLSFMVVVGDELG